MTTVAPFKNQHLSYSRLSRFETCPLSYRLHYIEKQEAEPGLPLRFGKTIHAVLERLIKEVVDDERTGPLSEERAIELYREAWGAEQLTGMDVFAEGLAILRRFIAEQGVVDHRDVLAIEKEFRLPVGPFEVLGFIDRVDWIDDEVGLTQLGQLRGDARLGHAEDVLEFADRELLLAQQREQPQAGWIGENLQGIPRGLHGGKGGRTPPGGSSAPPPPFSTSSS